jgi:uncharacterized membrane protein (UPF0127 family)
MDGTATPYLVASHKGRELARRVLTADDHESRGKGLLGRSSLDPDEGLWIVLGAGLWLVPCPTIHTFFMKFPIDVVFLDGSKKVVKVIENMKPWRLSAWVPSAASVLELSGGVLNGSVAVGDSLDIQ